MGTETPTTGSGEVVRYPDLLRDLMAGAGFSAAEADTAIAGAAERVRVLCARPLPFPTMREGGLSVLLEMLAFEHFLAHHAGRLAEALAAHYGLPRASLQWFALHSEVDVRHAEDGLEVARAYLAEKGYDTDEIWSSITVHEGSVQHLDFLTAHEKAVFKTAFEIDQRWLIDLGAERAPHICQSQSLNVFLPADVHKKVLHDIHFRAWKKGVKSLYYCRSRSIQRCFVRDDSIARSLSTSPTCVDAKRFSKCTLRM